jgi:phenylacetate-CoA ligase
MLYKSFLENVVFPAGDIVNGSSFTRELKYYRALQNADETTLLELSQKRLSAMLNHAVTNIPFYQAPAFANRGNDVQTWLKQFPVIRKKDIKGRHSEFINPSSKNLIPYESSGSSGIQGKVFMNKQEQGIIRAIMVLWWEWAGYRFGNSLVQTGMTPKRGWLKSMKDFLLRTEYFVAFGLDEKIVSEALLSFQKSKPQHLAGYASSLYLFGKIAKQKGIPVKLESVISWGDKMFPHYRSAIESAFDTKVFDTYACNEGLMIAAQHDLDYYYIMSPHVHVEIVDKNDVEVPDGELGYVVVTRLDNFSMPLIRYYNGDLAVKLPREKYPANRKMNFPLLERVIGRDTDIVRTRSGKYLIVHFFTGIFEFYPTIRQFRVIQKELDSIMVEYIPESDFDARILDEITTTIQGHLKEPFTVSYNSVDFIPATASGKPQIIKSELTQ